jgi:hypothetical protein
MYGAELVPRNLGLFWRLLTKVNKSQLFHLVGRNLKTGIFQDPRADRVIPNIYMNPTNECNRNCRGCYRDDEQGVMSHELAEEVADTALRVGINYVAWLGGEPLMPETRDLVLDVTGNFPRMIFNFCTNSYYVDDVVADRIADLPNLVPFVSVDGLRVKNDYRRGEGSYDKAMNAMRLFKERRLFFAYMATIMAHNKWEVSDQGFVEAMVENGAMLGGYSLFIAESSEEIGVNAVDYATVIQRLQKLARSMPLYMFSSDYGYLTNKAIQGSKRGTGVTITPSGAVKTERGGQPIGRIGVDGSLEDIIFDPETQRILREKVRGTGGAERDARLEIVQAADV